MEALVPGLSAELAVSGLGGTAAHAVVVVMAELEAFEPRLGMVGEVFEHQIGPVKSWQALGIEDLLQLLHDQAVLLLGAPGLHPGHRGCDVSCHVQGLVAAGDPIRGGLAVLEPNLASIIELPDAVPEQQD